MRDGNPAFQVRTRIGGRCQIQAIDYVGPLARSYIIAVPTGIVTVELAEAYRKIRNTQACPFCGCDEHLDAAKHCHKCGEKL